MFCANDRPVPVEMIDFGEIGPPIVLYFVRLNAPAGSCATVEVVVVGALVVGGVVATVSDLLLGALLFGACSLGVAVAPGCVVTDPSSDECRSNSSTPAPNAITR